MNQRLQGSDHNAARQALGLQIDEYVAYQHVEHLFYDAIYLTPYEQRDQWKFHDLVQTALFHALEAFRQAHHRGAITMDGPTRSRLLHRVRELIGSGHSPEDVAHSIDTGLTPIFNNMGRR